MHHYTHMTRPTRYDEKFLPLLVLNACMNELPHRSVHAVYGRLSYGNESVRVWKCTVWKCTGMKVHGYEKDRVWKWTGMKRPGIDWRILDSNKTLFLCFSLCMYCTGIYFMTGPESSSYNFQIWIVDIFYFRFQLVWTFSICSKFCVENWLLSCDLICKWITRRSGCKRFWKRTLHIEIFPPEIRK